MKFRFLIFGSALILLFLLILILTGGDSLKLEQIEESAVKQFHLPDRTPYKNPTSVIFAVDRSASMKGFTFTLGNAPRQGQTFEHLISRIVASLGGMNKEFYTFDKQAMRLPSYLSLCDPKTFTGSQADFSIPFSFVRDDTNQVMIIFTDLQFNNRTYYSELVDLFQREIRAHKYVKIFSAHPQFAGLIYPQMPDNVKPYWYPGTRPLYAIAIGRQCHANFIDEVLRDVMNWEHTITLSSHGPVVAKVIPPTTAKTFKTGVGDHTIGLKLGVGDTASFKMQMNATRISEWDQITTNEILVEGYSCIKIKERDSVAFNDTKNKLVIRSLTYQDGNPKILFHIKQNDGSCNTLWRVILRPRTVPSWVDSQSCVPGGNQAIKTLFFKEFVEDVLRSMTYPFALAAMHIYVCKD